MKLDLVAAKAEQAMREHAYNKANPAEKIISSRLLFRRAENNEGPEQDPQSKYITERPYLPKNRRCKRWAIS